MKLETLTSDIYHVNFSSQRDLASTFLRFQEHYESPEFKGDVFTLEEYTQWYASQSETGKFTYYEDWSGFNVPSYVFDRFFAGDFDPLSVQEETLLDLFRNRAGERFYVIGTFGPDPDSKQHEIAHGLFYTNDI